MTRTRTRLPRSLTALAAAFAAVATLTAVSVQAHATVSAPTTAQPGRDTLTWKACANHATFQCSTLRLPLDYDSPHGRRISVAVIRKPATDQAHRLGSIFWNAGGPGGPGVQDLPAVYPLFPAQMRARFDVVSFDPRGIGQSTQLHCFATAAQENALLAELPPGQFASTAAQAKQAAAVYAKFDKACATHGGAIQNHMSTANVARDMDRIRAALGERTWNYYGPSYGTYLGTTYANMFPSRVGRIVLDGNVDATAWNDAATGSYLNTFVRIGSAHGAETTLRLMMRECGKVDISRCAFSAGTPRATLAKYRALLTRVKAKPVTVAGTVVDYNTTVQIVASAMEFQNALNDTFDAGWKELEQLLQAAWVKSTTPSGTSNAPRLSVAAAPLAAGALALIRSARTNTPAGALSGGFKDMIPDGQDGLLCSESPNPTHPGTWQAQAEIANAGTPDGFGYFWSWLAEPCAQWQGRDTDRYTGPFNRYHGPYLLIGTAADPNTDYRSTLRLAATVRHARVLTENGGGHTAMLNKSTCIDNYVGAYLVRGSLPPVGTHCNQNKSPF